MTHDPLCPALGHGALPLIDLCRCGLIARIRDDERGESGDFCKGWDEGWLTGHAAALRVAVEVVRLSASADIDLVERSQIIAEIEGLGGKR